MSLDLNDALQTFIVESRELLQAMEDALLKLNGQSADPATINAIFRAAHTIKGSAGLFGLDHIVAFTHVAENVLDRVRNEELPLDEALAALFLEVCDQLNVLINLIAGKQPPDAACDAESQRIIHALGHYQLAHAGPSDEMPAPASETAISTVNSQLWHISMRPGPEMLRNGLDPLALLHYLESLGELRAVHVLTSKLPAFEALDPEVCHLGFEVALAASCDADTVTAAFDFIRDDCDLHLLPPQAPLAAYRDLLAARGDTLEMAAILQACHTLPNDCPSTVATEGRAHDACEAAPDSERPLSSTDSSPRTQDGKAVETNLIRVDAAKLDQLINLVGELIIAGAGAHQIARNRQLPDLVEATTVLNRLVEEVRDSALTLRMVQIGATFNRFRRVVRDVSREIGKDISLEIQGADTELDKTVVEKIGDPLTHIVRNAMDHGIETAEIRLARGKPAVGSLRLNAFHESGSIVIEVSDDGGGLNRQRILDKAIERGLIADGANLSDREILNLVFEPGFSTAEQVSKLSGRGVGMDVVRQNIQALRGSVELDSIEGEGTTVRIRLPLTLAIIDGFLVGVGNAAYVLPLDMVVECIELPESVDPAMPDYLNLRGSILPFLRLRECFAASQPAPQRQNIVVVQHGGNRAGLVVDRLMGEFQTVIKPLGKVFSQLRGIGGSTILGTGEVALILDVPGLIGHLGSSGNTAPLNQTQH